MSRLLGVTLLLSAASIAQAQNYVPIGADATDDGVMGTRDTARCHYDRVF